MIEEVPTSYLPTYFVELVLNLASFFEGIYTNVFVRKFVFYVIDNFHWKNSILFFSSCSKFLINQPSDLFESFFLLLSLSCVFRPSSNEIWRKINLQTALKSFPINSVKKKTLGNMLPYWMWASFQPLPFSSIRKFIFQSLWKRFSIAKIEFHLNYCNRCIPIYF